MRHTSYWIAGIDITGNEQVTNLEPTTITCTISGLLAVTTVTWKTADVADLTTVASDMYVIDTSPLVESTNEGEANMLESKLIIMRNALNGFTEAKTYTCCVIPSEDTVFDDSLTITVIKPGIHGSCNFHIQFKFIWSQVIVKFLFSGLQFLWYQSLDKLTIPPNYEIYLCGEGVCNLWKEPKDPYII